MHSYTDQRLVIFSEIIFNFRFRSIKYLPDSHFFFFGIIKPKSQLNIQIIKKNHKMLKDDPNEGLINQSNLQQVSRQSIKPKDTPVIEQEQETDHQKKFKRSEVTYILKTLNFIVGIAYVAFAAYCYYYGYDQQDIKGKGLFVRYVLPAYVGLSGLIILLIECRVGFLVRNMRFFYNYFGRGFFNVYAGLMPLMLINDWSMLSTFEIITIVASSVMCVIGLVYMCLKCLCCEKQGETVEKQNQSKKKPQK